jgi:hypothetical protein
MKQMIMIIAAIILIKGAPITILSIQTASAGPVNTSRSNIKSLVVEPSGDNSQATTQNYVVQETPLQPYKIIYDRFGYGYLIPFHL